MASGLPQQAAFPDSFQLTNTGGGGGGGRGGGATATATTGATGATSTTGAIGGALGALGTAGARGGGRRLEVAEGSERRRSNSPALLLQRDSIQPVEDVTWGK